MLIPEASVKAFADDIAMVFVNIERQLPQVMKLFAWFQSCAGWQLNLGKCVLIPL